MINKTSFHLLVKTTCCRLSAVLSFLIWSLYICKTFLCSSKCVNFHRSPQENVCDDKFLILKLLLLIMININLFYFMFSDRIISHNDSIVVTNDEKSSRILNYTYIRCRMVVWLRPEYILAFVTSLYYCSQLGMYLSLLYLHEDQCLLDISNLAYLDEWTIREPC